jgi:hypothetical protein
LFYRATISARVSTLLSQHPLQEESLLVLGMKPSLQKKFDPKKPFLGCVQRLGDPVLRPFLQDVVQFGPQVQLLTTIMLTKPLFIPQILRQVGIFPLFDWVRHFIALATYTILWLAAARFLSSWIKSLPEKKQYGWRRRLEAWQYGSGLDYHP